MKACTTKDVNAYREILLEKGLGYKLPTPVADLCVAVLGELRERDRNVFLAGRFSDDKTELLLLPPDEKVLRRFAEAFRSAEGLSDASDRTRSGSAKVAEAIETTLGPKVDEESVPEHEYPGWDGQRWVGAERKRLAEAGYYNFETAPPGGFPPRVRGDARGKQLDVYREKGVEVFCVSPHRLDKDGDIAEAYGLQAISEARPGTTPSVRSFEHEDRRWVTMGSVARGPFVYYADAYELVPAAEWKKRKPKGHYGGTKVTVRGERYVLGAKARFVPENAKTCR